MEIRRAEPEDAEKIVHLLLRTWIATYKPLGVDESDILIFFGDLQNKVEEYKKYFQEHKEQDINLVSYKGDRLTGVCFGYKEKNYTVLKVLYIDSEFQHQGIGTKLFELFQENAVGDIKLNVVNKNKKAINFYKGLGFKETHQRFNFKLTSTVVLEEIGMEKHNS